MGKKKAKSKQKKNYSAELMQLLGAVCEKLDKLITLVTKIKDNDANPWFPAAPYTPPLPIVNDPPVVVMYGCVPRRGEYDEYKKYVTGDSVGLPTTQITSSCSEPPKMEMP
jgi:hypothetical protein